MKSWLESKKIYFETLGVTLPSILAVFISLGALYISVDGRNLVRKQADLTQNLNRPLLSVSLDPIMDDQSVLISYSLKIVNQGALVREPMMEVLDFLDIECGNSEKGHWNLTLPIKDYFKVSYLTGNTVGEIGRLYPEKNFGRLVELYHQALFGQGSQVGASYAIPAVKSLVTITYETSYGERETLYFLAHNSGVKRISFQEAKKFINVWESKKVPDFDVPKFDSINVTDLLPACG